MFSKKLFKRISLFILIKYLNTKKKHYRALLGPHAMIHLAHTQKYYRAILGPHAVIHLAGAVRVLSLAVHPVC